MVYRRGGEVRWQGRRGRQSSRSCWRGLERILGLSRWGLRHTDHNQRGERTLKSLLTSSDSHESSHERSLGRG